MQVPIYHLLLRRVVFIHGRGGVVLDLHMGLLVHINFHVLEVIYREILMMKVLIPLVFMVVIQIG